MSRVVKNGTDVHGTKWMPPELKKSAKDHWKVAMGDSMVRMTMRALANRHEQVSEECCLAFADGQFTRHPPFACDVECFFMHFCHLQMHGRSLIGLLSDRLCVTAALPPSLVELRIGFTRCGVQGLAALLPAISSLPKLEVLHCAGNELGLDGFRLLANALPKMVSLQEL